MLEEGQGFYSKSGGNDLYIKGIAASGGIF